MTVILLLLLSIRKKYGSSMAKRLLNVQFNCNSNSLLTPDSIFGAAICNVGLLKWKLGIDLSIWWKLHIITGLVNAIIKDGQVPLEGNVNTIKHVYQVKNSTLSSCNY